MFLWRRGWEEEEEEEEDISRMDDAECWWCG